MDNAVGLVRRATLGFVPSPEARLQPYVRRQDGVVTTAQALAAGVTHRQLQALTMNGWSHPARGVFVEPEPLDAFRAGVRAALLVTPGAAACRITAARLHELWGLPAWSALEVPQLILPVGSAAEQHPGMQRYFGLQPHMCVTRQGLPVTNLGRTVSDLCLVLRFDDLVCLLDAALRQGWTCDAYPLSKRRAAQLRSALACADARSESALESVLRLVLVRAGLPPETLQLRLYTQDGICYARLDLAWPSRKLAVEADGREHHDRPEALYRDRQRQNQLVLAGWTVLRFTWADVLRRPQWIVGQVRAALAEPKISTD